MSVLVWDFVDSIYDTYVAQISDSTTSILANDNFVNTNILVCRNDAQIVRVNTERAAVKAKYLSTDVMDVSDPTTVNDI